MPPDVRRQYDEAMRAIGPALAGDKSSDTTRVFGVPIASGLQSNIVIRKTFNVSGHTYESVDEMPPEVRRLVESSLPAAMSATTSIAPGPHGAVDSSRSKLTTFVTTTGSPPPVQNLPIEPSTFSLKVRDFYWGLVFWVVVGLVGWYFLGR
jgi:hypothetical protein